MEPSWRRPAGIAAILLLILFWAVLIATFARSDRALADSRSGPVLSDCGNSLDRAVETLAAMVRNRTVAAAARRARLKQAYYSTISPRPVTQTIALNAAQILARAPAGSDPGGCALRSPGSWPSRAPPVRRRHCPDCGPAHGWRRRRRRRCWSASLPVDQALAINQSIALDTRPNPAAQPFALGKVDAATRARALECLTSAVYYEAGQESTDGQRAVAQVVLNRVRHPAFPANVCGVVYEGSTRADRLPVHLHLRRLADARADAPTPGSGRARSPKRRLPATSTSRSAPPPIITPITSSPTGPRP